MHTRFVPWTVIFLFRLLMTPKGKKGYIKLSPSSLNSFYYFLYIGFKDLVLKLNIILSFDLQ